MIDTTTMNAGPLLGSMTANAFEVFPGDTWRERGRRKRAVLVEATGFLCRVRWAHDAHTSDISLQTLTKRFTREPRA